MHAADLYYFWQEVTDFWADKFLGGQGGGFGERVG